MEQLPPSLLKMVVEECGLKIEFFRVGREENCAGCVKVLEDLRESIRNSRIPIYGENI